MYLLGSIKEVNVEQGSLPSHVTEDCIPSFVAPQVSINITYPAPSQLLTVRSPYLPPLQTAHLQLRYWGDRRACCFVSFLFRTVRSFPLSRKCDFVSYRYPSVAVWVSVYRCFYCVSFFVFFSSMRFT